MSVLSEAYQNLQSHKDVRTSLSEIRKEIRSEAGRAEWESITDAGQAVMRALSDEDPKARKNAAALLADLKCRDAADVLFDAYECEETRFVRAEYLNALKHTDCREYLPALKEQQQKLMTGEIGEEARKHVREELRALTELIRGQEKHAGYHRFCGLKRQTEAVLLTDPAFAKSVAEEIQGRKKIIPGGVRVLTDQYEELAQIRPVREILLVRPALEAEEPGEIAQTMLSDGLLGFLRETHSGEDCFCFRMELAGMEAEARIRLTKQISAALEDASGFDLINSTSEYEVEFRLIRKKSGEWLFFVKLFTVTDPRFLYRREVISAGMQPYLAAGLAALARPYMKEHAQVLDCFCGAGTWLIERNYVLPSRSAYGIDTFGEAVKKARINSETARMPIHYINRNFFDFTHEYLFDEIYADFPEMPENDRAGADRFYRQFLQKADSLLAAGGRIFVYTRENQLLKKQLRLHKGFRILQETVIQKKSEKTFYVLGRAGEGGQENERNT